MIPLLQTKTAGTADMGIFGSDTRPLSRFFWVGPGELKAPSPTYRRDLVLFHGTLGPIVQYFFFFFHVL